MSKSVKDWSVSLQPEELEQIRGRARLAVEGFIQALLDQPENAHILELDDKQPLAEALWREGLIIVFRLLFILKLERSTPAPQFTKTGEWKESYSPTKAFGPDKESTEEGVGRRLRDTFRVLHEGASTSEISIPPLGGTFFAPSLIATLEPLFWSDHALHRLLDCLLYLPGTPSTPVPYEKLEAEDLGRVYEALIDLEPGLASETLCRLRHPRLEVVVPNEQGEPFRRRKPTGKKGSNIRWIERIEPGRFFVRSGLGRKTTGSYYTPRDLVRFLVRETLTPKIRELSPRQDPNPHAIMGLRVLDPAMGSGHFLVEVCRYLGRALAKSLLRCHDLADEAEAAARRSSDTKEARELRERAVMYRDRAPTFTPGDIDLARQLEASCRRVIAEQCLYGVDLNPLAVELAKLVLWLETFVEGAPLPQLDQHLICGDSLTGASLENLRHSPGSGKPLPALLARTLDDQVKAAPHRRSLRTLAAAWSGGVMVDTEPQSKDLAYGRLLQAFLDGQDLEDTLCPEGHDALVRKMIDVGLPGVPFEVVFPELLRHEPDGTETFGFDAVVGNPPWDKVLPLEREFYGSYNVTVLTVPTARERRPLYKKLKQDKHIRDAWYSYSAPFAHTRRFIDATYRWQVTSVSTSGRRKKTTGHADRYRYFVERSWEVLTPRGRLGMVLPNTLYNASGATGIRHLILEESTLELCLGFSNARGLFDIGSGQRFCLVVTCKGGRTATFGARFGLDDPEALFQQGWRDTLLDFDMSFLERTSPGYLCFLELSSLEEHDVVSAMYGDHSTQVSRALPARGLNFYQEMNMTTDSSRFVGTREALELVGLSAHLDPRLEPTRSQLVDEGWLVVHEKGTFHAYNDCVKSQPRYVCHTSQLVKSPRQKLKALDASRFYRLVARSTIHATEASKAVFCMIPPSCVVGNSALSESIPGERPNAEALIFMAVCNSRPFNFVTKLRMGTNLNQFIFESLPFPKLLPCVEVFCAHSALRLSCNHEAYRQLWADQISDVWHEGREDSKVGAKLLASIDAVVALSYGLTRLQYVHVLGATEDHPIRGLAQELFLEAFDELHSIGLDAFSAQHDPYDAIPLVTSLPPNQP